MAPTNHGSASKRAKPDGGNGVSDPQGRRLLEAINTAHDLPGFYPVVVIARQSLEFSAILQATVASEQGAAPFRITERESRKGTYVSYRVEMYVPDAVSALARKAVLGELEGVIVVL